MDEIKKAWTTKEVNLPGGKSATVVVDSKGRPFMMQAFRFDALTKPNGFLDNHPGCQGLFYYTILIKGQRIEELDPLQYDDEWPPRIQHAKTLFTSIALLYGVAPETMIQFWPNVDLQCVSMGSPKVHADLRFDKVPEIRTQ